MDAFDVQCPRCQGRGLAPPPAASPSPPAPQARARVVDDDESILTRNLLTPKGERNLYLTRGAAVGSFVGCLAAIVPTLLFGALGVGVILGNASDPRAAVDGGYTIAIWGGVAWLAILGAGCGWSIGAPLGRARLGMACGIGAYGAMGILLWQTQRSTDTPFAYVPLVLALICGMIGGALRGMLRVEERYDEREPQSFFRADWELWGVCALSMIAPPLGFLLYRSYTENGDDKAGAVGWSSLLGVTFWLFRLLIYMAGQSRPHH